MQRLPMLPRVRQFLDCASNLGYAISIRPLLWLLGFACLLGSGCQTYKQQNRIVEYWQRSDLAAAEREASLIAEKQAKSMNENDAILWRLEQGTVLRAEGKYEESNRIFNLAADRMDRYAESAKVKLGRESAALLSNQANLPYEGRSYDGIMLNTYKALNYLQLNQPDKARVEIIRTYQRQQEAVVANQRRIEKTQEQLNNAKAEASRGSAPSSEGKVDADKIDKACQDQGFQSQLEAAYRDLNRQKAYSDYVNPFSVYLDGLLFMATASGGSDLERARLSLERVCTYAQNNKHVKADLETLNNLLQGRQPSPTTYVIFETGRAPVRDQVRIDIPIIITQVSYVGAAFPKLEPQADCLYHLNVIANGVTEQTATVASMDAVIGNDFKNELPIIITKTLASTIAKAAATYAINAAADQADSTVGWFARVLTATYGMAVNIADLRTWTTLPKEFQCCRVGTPADRKIELQVPSSGQRIAVTVGEGTINLIYVKCISATGPLLVSQMKLK
jgi:uncharacterized protein